MTAESKNKAKKKYIPPKLVVVGHVARVTQKSGNAQDAASPHTGKK